MSKSTYNVTRHEPSEKVIEHIIRLEQLLSRKVIMNGKYEPVIKDKEVTHE